MRVEALSEMHAGTAERLDFIEQAKGDLLRFSRLSSVLILSMLCCPTEGPFHNKQHDCQRYTWFFMKNSTQNLKSSLIGSIGTADSRGFCGEASKGLLMQPFFLVQAVLPPIGQNCAENVNIDTRSSRS